MLHPRPDRLELNIRVPHSHLIIIAMQQGRTLRWDPVKEVFTGEGASEANQHLSREMRKPYDYSYVS